MPTARDNRPRIRVKVLLGVHFIVMKFTAKGRRFIFFLRPLAALPGVNSHSGLGFFQWAWCLLQFSPRLSDTKLKPLLTQFPTESNIPRNLSVPLFFLCFWNLLSSCSGLTVSLSSCYTDTNNWSIFLGIGWLNTFPTNWPFVLSFEVLTYLLLTFTYILSIINPLS